MRRHFPGLCATSTTARMRERAWAQLILAKDGPICRPSWSIVLCGRERTGPEPSVDVGTPTTAWRIWHDGTFIRLLRCWRRRCFCRRRSRPPQISSAPAHKPPPAHKSGAGQAPTAQPQPQAKQLPPRIPYTAADGVAAAIPGMPDARFWANRSRFHRRLAAAARTVARAVERRRRWRIRRRPDQRFERFRASAGLCGGHRREHRRVDGAVRLCRAAL